MFSSLPTITLRKSAFVQYILVTFGIIFIFFTQIVSPYLLLGFSAAVICVLFPLLFIKHPEYSLLFLFISKPTIDIFWNVKFYIIGSFYINPLMITGGIIFIAGLLCIVARNVEVMRSPIAIPTLLFGAINLYAVLISRVPIFGLADLFRTVFGFPLLFITGKVFTTEKKINRMLVFCLLSSVTPLLGFVLQYFGWISITRYTSDVARYSGFYHGPHETGLYLLVFTPITIFFILKTGLRHKPYLYILLLLTYVIVMIQTTFRTGLIALFSQFAGLAYIKRKGKAFVILTGVFLLFYFVFYSKITSFLDFSGLSRNFLASEISSRRNIPYYYDNFSGRIGIWMYQLGEFNKESNFHKFFGVGMNSTSIYTMRISEYYSAGGDAHSTYLRMLIDLGVFGLFVFLWMVFRIFHRTTLVLKKENNKYFRDLAEMFLLLILAYLVMGLTFNSDRYPSFNLYFYSFAGIILDRSSIVSCLTKDKKWQTKYS